MRKLSAFAAVLVLGACTTSSIDRDQALQTALQVLTPIVIEQIQKRCDGSRDCILTEARKEQRKRPNRRRRQ